MYYFAYGSNMNHRQMEERCPGARFLKCAYLEDFRFVYDGYHEKRRGAVANVIKAPGGKVWGALFEMDEKHLAALDRYEGYPSQYGRAELPVKDDDGIVSPATVYLRHGLVVGTPSDDYRGIVLRGAFECALPDDYIQSL